MKSSIFHREVSREEGREGGLLFIGRAKTSILGYLEIFRILGIRHLCDLQASSCMKPRLEGRVSFRGRGGGFP